MGRSGIRRFFPTGGAGWRRGSGRDKRPDSGVPALVCYLAMAIRAVPNLERALLFASSQLDGYLGRYLRGKLWELGVRRRRSGEEVLQDLAREWEGSCSGLGRSLSLISSSTREASEECRERSLDMSLSMVLQGALERAREYASRVHHPVLLLYAVGVLLPLVISTMVPVISLTGFSGGHLVLVLNCALCPLAVWFMGKRILRGRPSCFEEVRIPLDPPRPGQVAAAVGICLVFPAVACLLGLESTWQLISVLWAGSVLLALLLFSVSIRPYREWRSVLEMEDDLPRMLVHMGNRMLEGRPAEEAIYRAAESCGSGELRAVLLRAASRVRFGGEGLRSALFGDEGVFRAVPSGMVRGAMKAMMDLSEIGTKAGGEALLYISRLVERMKEANREMRRMMEEVVSSMRSVATIFAPLIAGVTASIFSSLSRIHGLRLFGWASLPSDVFAFAMGLYALMLCAILNWLAVEIEFGGQPSPKLMAVGSSVPLAVLIFTVSFSMGSQFVGMLVR